MLIVDCKIAEGPRIIPMIPGPMAVTVTYEDGSSEVLFEYYSDELSFSRNEFIGLSRDEAKRLHYQRDMQWLRS